MENNDHMDMLKHIVCYVGKLVDDVPDEDRGSFSVDIICSLMLNYVNYYEEHKEAFQCLLIELVESFSEYASGEEKPNITRIYDNR